MTDKIYKATEPLPHFPSRVMSFKYQFGYTMATGKPKVWKVYRERSGGGGVLRWTVRLYRDGKTTKKTIRPNQFHQHILNRAIYAIIKTAHHRAVEDNVKITFSDDEQEIVRDCRLALRLGQEGWNNSVYGVEVVNRDIYS